VSGPDAGSTRGRVAEIPEWYHTLELAPGVVTPGWFDLRDLPGQLPIPASTAGLRCLDIGTFDGFWAFELERRGADEVVAVDVLDPQKWDWPAGSTDAVLAAVGRRKAAGRGFEVARDALGSKVQRHEMSVYDLDPEVVGTFDFVYVGSLLLHLRDPVRAIERVASICRGQALFVDAIDLPASRLFPRRPLASLDGVGRPWWWKPNLAGLARMITVGGFDVQHGPQLVYMRGGAGFDAGKVPLRRLRRLDGWQDLVTQRRGEPHAAVLAKPRSAG
jgi:tRNA (mo5U34)-methyltransferase